VVETKSEHRLEAYVGAIHRAAQGVQELPLTTPASVGTISFEEALYGLVPGRDAQPYWVARVSDIAEKNTPKARYEAAKRLRLACALISLSYEPGLRVVAGPRFTGAHPLPFERQEPPSTGRSEGIVVDGADLAKVNGDPFVSHDRYITGREVLELAGLLPPKEYTLRVKVAGQRLQKVGLDEKVDLRRPGIEKFKALPRDQFVAYNRIYTDGNAPLRFPPDLAPISPSLAPAKRRAQAGSQR